MKLKLQTLSHASLVWTSALPPGFTGIRLPGGSLLSSMGEFGTLCIQEFNTNNYTIRYSVFDLLEQFVLKSKSRQSGLHAQLVLIGESEQEIKGDGKQVCKKNQFGMFQDSSSEIIAVFKEGTKYQTLDTFFSSGMVKEMLPLFPAVRKMLNNHPGKIRMLTKQPVWADANTLEIIQSILHCRYQKDLRRYFFNSRVRDLLFKYLVQLNDYDPYEKQPSDKEIQAVYEAEAIINKDITKHSRIPELSKMVLLNEFRFKAVFKKIFGMGPYEYLLRKRMKKAKDLLEAGLSVKEVAAETGYRPTDFTSAFINHYGFTPSSVKRKGS